MSRLHIVWAEILVKLSGIFQSEKYLSKYSGHFWWFSPPKQYVGGSLAESHDSLILTKVENRTFLGKKFGIYRTVTKTESENRVQLRKKIWIRMKDAPKRCFMPYWIYRWVVCFAVSTFFKNFKISCWTWIFILNFNLCQKHQSFVNGKYHSFQLEWQYRDFWLKVNKHRWKNSFHSPCDFQTGFLSDDFFVFSRTMKEKWNFWNNKSSNFEYLIRSSILSLYD